MNNNGAVPVRGWTCTGGHVKFWNRPAGRQATGPTIGSSDPDHGGGTCHHHASRELHRRCIPGNAPASRICNRRGSRQCSRIRFMECAQDFLMLSLEAMHPVSTTAMGWSLHLGAPASFLKIFTRFRKTMAIARSMNGMSSPAMSLSRLDVAPCRADGPVSGGSHQMRSESARGARSGARAGGCGIVPSRWRPARQTNTGSVITGTSDTVSSPT